MYFREHLGQDDSKALYTWLGSLATNGAGGTTGLLYRRNRYYDSETGRWTQEDPVGIAGGINVFGFVAGDPVNYTDPFGLCPPYDKNLDDCSDEVKRLLAEDQALLDVSAETIAVASGVVGVARGTFGAAFNALFRRSSANAVSGVATSTTSRFINAVESAGPRMSSRIDAISRTLRQLNIKGRMTTNAETGVVTIRGGAGDRAREIILNPDGSSIIRGFDSAGGVWRTIKEIKPQ